MPASVLLPAGLIMFHAEGPFLAVADGLDAVSRYSGRDQKVLGGLGTAIAKGQVIFRRAALVAVAFQSDFDLRIRAQELSGCGQGIASVRPDIGFVEIKVGVFDFLCEELFHGGLPSRRGGRRCADRDAHVSVGRASGTRGGNRVGLGGLRVNGRRSLWGHIADAWCEI